MEFYPTLTPLVHKLVSTPTPQSYLQHKIGKTIASKNFYLQKEKGLHVKQEQKILCLGVHHTSRFNKMAYS